MSTPFRKRLSLRASGSRLSQNQKYAASENFETGASLGRRTESPKLSLQLQQPFELIDPNANMKRNGNNDCVYEPDKPSVPNRDDGGGYIEASTANQSKAPLINPHRDAYLQSEITDDEMRELYLSKRGSTKKKTVFTMAQRLPFPQNEIQKDKEVNVMDMEKGIMQMEDPSASVLKSWDDDDSIYEMIESCQTTDKGSEIRCDASKSDVYVADRVLVLLPDSDSSKSFSTRIYLENESPNSVEFKVDRNSKAQMFFTVTPQAGAIGPENVVYLTVRTRELQENISSEMVADAKFTVKMFQMSSNDNPEIVITKTFDQVILTSPENPSEMKRAIDAIKSPRERLVYKENFHRQESNKIKLTVDYDYTETQEAIQAHMELLFHNQHMRNKLCELRHLASIQRGLLGSILCFIAFMIYCILLVGGDAGMDIGHI